MFRLCFNNSMYRVYWTLRVTMEVSAAKLQQVTESQDQFRSRKLLLVFRLNFVS